MNSLSCKIEMNASRRLLLGGAISVAAAGFAGLPWARSAWAASNADPFMTASSYLIQHRLSPDVGARIARAMLKADPQLETHLKTIIQTAQAKGAKTVEDFFDALPEGPVKQAAHKIIFAWYAGVLDASPTAEVFAFELALMYQPVKDAMAVPSYAFSGPNNWTNVHPPLSAVPEF